LTFLSSERQNEREIKPAPPPEVPGSTEAERMDNALRLIFSVPRDAYLKQEARLKRARARERAAKKRA
jgi:hypothetical protein